MSVARTSVTLSVSIHNELRIRNTARRKQSIWESGRPSISEWTVKSALDPASTAIAIRTLGLPLSGSHCSNVSVKKTG